MSVTFGPTLIYRHVPAGRHELVVRLLANNETLVGSPARVKFSVRPKSGRGG